MTRPATQAAILIALLTSSTARAQQLSIGSISQKGVCTVAGVTGNATITCTGVDPALVRRLNQTFQDELKKRDLRIDDLTKTVNQWKDDYLALTHDLADAGINSGLKAKVDELVSAGKIDEAMPVVDKILALDDEALGKIADDQFRVGMFYKLRFKPAEALQHLEKAHIYDPESRLFGIEYGALLCEQGECAKAESVFSSVVAVTEAGVAKDPKEFEPDLAKALTERAVAQYKQGKLPDAGSSFERALPIWRSLLQADPKWSDLASETAEALTGLAAVYVNTGHLKEAEDDLVEALNLDRRVLPGDDPHLAIEAVDLAGIYLRGDRLQEAEQSYLEAIPILRKLVGQNQEHFNSAYAADLGDALDGLAGVYAESKRGQLADQTFAEALSLLWEAAKVNPQYAQNLWRMLTNEGGFDLGAAHFAEAATAYEEAFSVYRNIEDQPGLQPGVRAAMIQGMLDLGRVYEQGRAAHQDYQQAEKWYGRAAGAGNPVAMRNLGLLYQQGHGVGQSAGEGRRWLEKAAAAGDTEAQNDLKSLPQ